MFYKDKVGKTGGGGVLIAVNKTYVNVRSKVKTQNSNCELIEVRIQLKGQKDLIVGSFYRSDWTDDEFVDNI